MALRGNFRANLPTLISNFNAMEKIANNNKTLQLSKRVRKFTTKKFYGLAPGICIVENYGYIMFDFIVR